MTSTINVSIPTKMYKKAKKLVAEGKYHSISELLRAGLRRTFYEVNQITENGFPGWFEDRILESADEPSSKDKVWETEEDINRYFKKFHKKVIIKKQKKYVKDQTDWQIQPVAR